MSDPGSTYRTRDEVSSMRQARDPVERVRKLLLDNKFADAAELKSIEKAIKKEIDEAIEEAKAASQPPREWLQVRARRHMHRAHTTAWVLLVFSCLKVATQVAPSLRAPQAHASASVHPYAAHMYYQSCALSARQTLRASR